VKVGEFFRRILADTVKRGFTPLRLNFLFLKNINITMEDRRYGKNMQRLKDFVIVMIKER